MRAVHLDRRERVDVEVSFWVEARDPSVRAGQPDLLELMDVVRRSALESEGSTGQRVMGPDPGPANMPPVRVDVVPLVDPVAGAVRRYNRPIGMGHLALEVAQRPAPTHHDPGRVLALDPHPRVDVVLILLDFQRAGRAAAHTCVVGLGVAVEVADVLRAHHRDDPGQVEAHPNIG